MKFRLEFEMENEAFEDGNAGTLEAARILRHVAGRLCNASLGDRRKVLDGNGNTVGQWEITE